MSALRVIAVRAVALVAGSLVIGTPAVGVLGCADVLGFERARLDTELNAEEPDTLSSDTTDDTNTADGNDAGASSVLGVVMVSDAAAPQVNIDVSMDSAPPLTASVPSCEAYCELVLEACPSSDDEAYAVYDSPYSCLKQCEFLPEGDAGDTTGNSRACRAAHARLAKEFPGERGFECPAAGPGGAGVCGSNCDGYCSLMQGLCSDSLEGDCNSLCGSVPDLGGYDISVIEGDSIQCRLYHLGAATASPQFHCAHAAGENTCVDP